MTRLRAGFATHTGRVRSINQDAALVRDDLVAVADGMGGHLGGEVAARTAVEVLGRAFGPRGSTPGLTEAVRQANRAIWDESRARPDVRGMGTTVTAAALVKDSDGEHLAFVNVGDSRAYVLVDGTLTRLTEDHSYVEEMLRRGEITPREAIDHPNRHILTRALGVEETVEVDSWKVDLPEGARVLLCSDGLTNEVDEDELEVLLGEGQDPDEVAARLVDRALEHGGNDNITVIVVDILDVAGDGGPSPGSTASAGAGGAGAAAAPAGRDPAPAHSARRSASTAVAAAVVAPLEATARGASPVAAGASPTTTARVPIVGQPPAGGRSGSDDAGAAGEGLLPASRPESQPRPAPGPRPVTLVPKRHKRRPRRVDPIVTFRVVIFTLLLVSVLGGAAGLVGWVAKASYYVGLRGDQVVIYQGRPGGFLWFDPVIAERAHLTTSQIYAPAIPVLHQGLEEPSLAAARLYVAELKAAGPYGPYQGQPLGPSTTTSQPASGTGATAASTVGR
jgi:protein phosphatase